FRGGAFVTKDSSKCRAACVTSSTARLKAASFACDGCVKRHSFLTNCSDDARISSCVAGGAKLCRVLMFRHMPNPAPRITRIKRIYLSTDCAWSIFLLRLAGGKHRLISLRCDGEH